MFGPLLVPNMWITKINSILKKFNDSRVTNALRKVMWFHVLKWHWNLGFRRKQPLRLHLGCGNTHFENYLNIDWRKTGATDAVCDIRKLPFPCGSVSTIETYHVIEHLSRHDLPRCLREWNRILSPRGKLVIECPDFDEIVRKYIEGDEKQLDGIFALQRFKGDYHFFGYNFKRLKSLLEENGFVNVQSKEPQDYHARVEGWSCIRIECEKKLLKSFIGD
jgi:predicted SAM-dependent methyltransferase